LYLVSFDHVLIQLKDLLQNNSKAVFGRPHSRVPDVLLLYEERKAWFTVGDFFLFSNQDCHTSCSTDYFKLKLKLISFKVPIELPRKTGTGFLHSETGLLLTNVGTLTSKRSKQLTSSLQHFQNVKKILPDKKGNFDH